MSATTASIIGIPSKSTWSSTATHKAAKENFWCAASFSGDEQSPFEGRRFIKFFENLEPTSLAELYKQLDQGIQHIRKETFVSVAFVLTGQKTLLATWGGGVIGLVRDGRVRWLADGSAERVVLEGDVRPGDFLVLGTARARELGLTDSLLSSADPDALVAALFARTQQHVHSGEIALQCIRIEALAQEEGKKEITEMAEEAVVVSPVPLPSSSSGTKHLISPQKLEAGILASAEEQKVKVKRALALPDLHQFLARVPLAKVHWIRAGIAAAVLGMMVFAFVGYRAYSVGKERREVLVPLQTLAQELSHFRPEQRAEQRVAAQTLLERLKATRIVYNANARELVLLTEQVEKLYGEISGERSVVNLPVFFDFRLIQADFLATKVSREKEQAVFLDTNAPAYMRVNLNTKKNEKLPIEGTSAPVDVALATGTTYSLGGKTLTRLPMGEAKHTVLASLDGLVEGSQLETFGDTLYVLDRAGQQIWRVGTGEDASPSGWVRSARGIDFSKITSMTINGAIWLGSEDGEIFKLSRGERETFVVNGLPEAFTSSLLLSATQTGEKLAVVEPKKERMVILNKNGEYLLQVHSPQIGAVTDVLLSEDEKIVYLIAGSVVYAVEI